MAELACDIGISKSTVFRHVREAGKVYLYCQEKPLLSVDLMDKWLNRAHFLLNELKHGRAVGRVIISSDEKTFTVDPVHNCQNDRLVSFQDNRDLVDELRTISKTKHPTSMMMLDVITSNGAHMDTVWFPTGYTLMVKDYLKILKDKALP